MRLPPPACRSIRSGVRPSRREEPIILTHTRTPAGLPSRTVVIGAAGFVGAAVADRIEAKGGAVLRLARTEIDLTAAGADRRLAEQLRPDDACVFIAARAPCKNPAMLAENIGMAANVCAALAAGPVDQLIYVSSDAVYADSEGPLTEASAKAPDSLHGAMHLSRELMLRDTMKTGAFAVLRPTLIYGAADPHSGYGPNLFRRLACEGRDITLFGEGEERRDHVSIGDVAEVVVRTLMHRSAGSLNVASGTVHSFRAIAEKVVALHGSKVKVLGSKRNGPMPHGGYRPFDVSAIGKAFPDLKLTQLMEGIEGVHKALAG